MKLSIINQVPLRIYIMKIFQTKMNQLEVKGYHSKNIVEEELIKLSKE